MNCDQEESRRRYQSARNKANQLGLRVYRNDVIDWVIASSPADCNEAYAEHTGEPVSAIYDGEYDWRALPLDRTLNMHMDDGRGSVEQTCAEWIAEQGRGFLGSTEY